MKSAILSLSVLALAGGVSHAGTTISAQVFNGSEWSDRVTVNPFINRDVRVRYVISTDNPDAAALHGANFQPTVSRWIGLDSVDLGFVSGGTSGMPENGADASFETGNDFGRVSAFGFANIRSTQALTAHQNLIGGLNTMRVAQAPVINEPGTGSGSNNISGGGVPIVQIAGGPGRLPGSAAIVTGRINVVVYGFRIRVGGSGTDRNLSDRTKDLTIGASALGEFAQVLWYNDADLAAGNFAAAIDDGTPTLINSAFIDVVPGPSGVAMALAIGLAQSRRRRLAS
jgi:hypothetical protein